MYVYSSIICFLDSTREAVHGVGAQAGWTSLLTAGNVIFALAVITESKGERMEYL